VSLILVQRLKVRDVSLGFEAGASEEPMPPRMALSHFRMMMVATRHCERSEVIQTVTAEGLWIASLRSQ
jgi:hypothetical protein